MRLYSIIIAASIVSVLPAANANAQARDADSTSFRAGQWGAEFLLGAITGGASGAGALRFFSPTHALVLDVSAEVAKESGSSPLKQKQAGFGVRAGSRWYRPATHRVVQYFALGASVSLGHLKQETVTLSPVSSSEKKTNSIGAGAFAELGASWLITPQLSLGASWDARVQYARITQRTVSTGAPLTAPDDIRFNRISAALGALSLRAGVYF